MPVSMVTPARDSKIVSFTIVSRLGRPIYLCNTVDLYPILMYMYMFIAFEQHVLEKSGFKNAIK